VLFARGVQLAPAGSVEDRLMREMVFRERQERVAHMDAVAKMLARLFNVDADKMFGHVMSEYAFEVFQEAYDADLLRKRADAKRKAQQRVRAKRQQEEDLMKKLDNMEKAGREFDTEAARVAPAVTKKALRKPLPAGPKKPIRSK
jgi:hypothetical protein